MHYKTALKTIYLPWIPILLVFLAACNSQETNQNKYGISELPLEDVQITGGFWAPVLETSRESTLPHIFSYCENSGRIENFFRAAGIHDGPHIGERYNDTDVFKTIEGASYHLVHSPNDTLETYIDSIVVAIEAAQEDDGYLYTPRTIDPAAPTPGAGKRRWEDVWISHELYNAGHLYEAATAYYFATGKDRLLKVAMKNADCVISVFNDDGLKLAPGHQEIEIGLVKLYKATGERKYLEQAQFFLDQRGKEVEREEIPKGDRFEIYNEREYLQYHKPVREQNEAVGHAVRAMYMYAGMTDVGVLLKDDSLLHSVKSIWDDILASKIYLTGGVGASHRGEAFSKPYVLPNKTAYCETCAAAGSLFWNQRMFHLTGEQKYMDVLETTLYNGFLSGVSLDGKEFFYPNPLESEGNYQRSEWFGVACCPGNVARVIPSLNRYIYSIDPDHFYVNLYIESSAKCSFNDVNVNVSMETDYPWNGKVNFHVNPEMEVEHSIVFRIPQWTRGSFLPGELYPYMDSEKLIPVLTVNGEEIALKNSDSEVTISRTWKPGDMVEIEFPMVAKLVTADERVQDDRGKAAIVRGPLVYTFEGIDNNVDFEQIELSEDGKLESNYHSDLLNGIMLISSGELQAIPYYAWANRGAAEMKVWLNLK